MNLAQYKEKYYDYRGQLNSLTKLLEEEKENNTSLNQDFLDAEKATDIIHYVAKQTQDNLTFRIENLVTAGLEFVFEDPYQFKVEFDTRKGVSQCDLFFERDGMKIDPMSDSGFGALDIASISLRLAMWSLQQDRSSACFTMDEPTRHVSRDLRERSSLFLKEMCDRLGIQIITATHEDELIEGSDNVIEVMKEDKFSKVKEK